MHYFSKIRKLRETDEGTDLIVTILGEKLGRQISKFKAKDSDTVDAEIKINDGRTITIEQRKKIYATVRDISAFIGDDPEYLKEYLKYDYCAMTGEEYFSLSNCSVTTARDFISHIIDFILKWDIPLTDKALNRTEDIDRYLYGCVKYRKCCITGKSNADIHHVTGSRIGMGRNRKKISHEGLELMALSRDWHNKVHQEGEEEIFNLYKIYGIIIDNETLVELGLTRKEIT